MLPFVFLTVAALPLPPDVDADLFPGADAHTATEVQLAGLAALYPGRILHAPPDANDKNNEKRQPRIAEPKRDITYLRIYDLDSSLDEIKQDLSKPALILDLRYLTADADSSQKFAQLLLKAGLACAPLQGVGTYGDPETTSAEVDHPPPPIVVMVNGLTSGPLEAWLAAFQEKESILAVGTPTAGQPGEYRALADSPGYYIIRAELKPDNGSIVGTGLKPRFPVDVTPQQDYVAYNTIEKAQAEIPAMLRQEHLVTAAPAAPAATSTALSATAPLTQQPSAPATSTVITEARDPVLQRAVDVVVALQVLGRLTPSSEPGAAKTPAATAGAAPAQR